MNDSATLFQTELNDMCRKYWIGSNPNHSIDEIMSFGHDHALMSAKLFEAFLLFDQVNIKVYGENLPLMFLYQAFGKANLFELAEQGALRFTLWTPMIMHFVSDISGVDLLVSGNHTEKVYSDPEKSISEAMKRLRIKHERPSIHEFIRKFRDLYIVPHENFAHDIVNITMSALKSGKLEQFGFDSKTDPRASNITERMHLNEYASSLLEYRFVLRNKLTSFSNYRYCGFLLDTLHRSEARSMKEITCKICEIEECPDFQTLYSIIDNPFDKLIKIRKRNTSKQLRKWLKNFSKAIPSEHDIIHEYIQQLSPKPYPTGKRLVKRVFYILAGKLLEWINPAAAIGFDLVDELALEPLRQGWNPKFYFEDMKKLPTQQ